MNIEVFAINPDRDVNEVEFIPLNKLQTFQGSSDIDPKIYDRVYKGEVFCSSLGELFVLFNCERAKYMGRSFSTSDVIKVAESDNVEDGFYFCDKFGFKKIEFDSQKCGAVCS